MGDNPLFIVTYESPNFIFVELSTFTLGDSRTKNLAETISFSSESTNMVWFRSQRLGQSVARKGSQGSGLARKEEKKEGSEGPLRERVKEQG